MRWDTRLAADLVEQLWENPKALLNQGRVLQSKRRCSVVRLDLATGSYVLRSHICGGPIRALKKVLQPTPALKSWKFGREMLAAGIRTARPLAYLNNRESFDICSYLLTEYIPGIDLYRLMRFEQPTAATVHNIAQQVAAIWQRLHELQICHGDLKTENLIIDASSQVWLIDLEKTRRHVGRSRLYSRQAIDAKELLHPRNWRAAPGAAEIFRQYILRTDGAAELMQYLAQKTHPLNRPATKLNDPAQLVTVLIPVRNDAEVILNCLESVRNMADEILVVDLGSSDRTLDIVRSTQACRVPRTSNLHGDELLNSAQRRAAHPWVLTVLPHERVSATLSKEIQDVLASGPKQIAFKIALRDQFHTRTPKGGLSRHETAIRLHRRDLAQYVERDGRLELKLASTDAEPLRSKRRNENLTIVRQLVYELIGSASTLIGARTTIRSAIPAYGGPRSNSKQSGLSITQTSCRTALAVARKVISRTLQHVFIDRQRFLDHLIGGE